MASRSGRPCCGWTHRAAAEAAEITATGHPSLWYTGGQVSPEWMLPKALWLRRHEPARYARARWLVELHDWILYRLTGRWALAAATASAEWGYDPHAEAWPGDLLAEVGLADLPQRWPEVVLAPGEPAGAVTPAGAAADRAATGAAGLPGADGQLRGGAGLRRVPAGPGRGVPGQLLVLHGARPGAGLGPAAAWAHPRRAGAGYHPDAGRPDLRRVAGPLVLHRARRRAGRGGAGRRRAAVPPGSDGIIALDTWQGSRTPFRDPHRRGAFTGLALGHGRAHLYRAILESVAYGGRQVTEAFEQAGAGLGELVFTGGGSGSGLWRQIHADVIGRPLLRLAQPQPAALGAAMCAAAGLGACPDLRSAAAAMSRVVPGAEPDPGNRHAYETAFRAYQDAARALAPRARPGQARPAAPGPAGLGGSQPHPGAAAMRRADQGRLGEEAGSRRGTLDRDPITRAGDGSQHGSRTARPPRADHRREQGHRLRGR